MVNTEVIAMSLNGQDILNSPLGQSLNNILTNNQVSLDNIFSNISLPNINQNINSNPNSINNNSNTSQSNNTEVELTDNKIFSNKIIQKLKFNHHILILTNLFILFILIINNRYIFRELFTEGILYIFYKYPIISIISFLINIIVTIYKSNKNVLINLKDLFKIKCLNCENQIINQTI